MTVYVSCCSRCERKFITIDFAPQHCPTCGYRQTINVETSRTDLAFYNKNTGFLLEG